MAVDPKDDDRDDVDDDDDERGPSRRVPKVLGAQKSLPSVESALDDFIVRANQKLLDVSEFTPEVREQGLRDEIDDLKKRLAAAKTRAELAEAASAASPKRSWGAVVAAFVVGGATMFAINLAMQTDDKRESPAASAPAVPAAGSPATPTPTPTAPTSDTVATPAPAVPPDEPDAPEPTAPAPVETALKPATEAAAKRVASTPAKPKPPKQGATRRPAEQPAPKDASTNTAKPPPADKGSGAGDLYNPF